MNLQILDTLSSFRQKYSFQYYTGIIIFTHFFPLSDIYSVIYEPQNIYFCELVYWILAANLNSLQMGSKKTQEVASCPSSSP